MSNYDKYVFKRMIRWSLTISFMVTILLMLARPYFTKMELKRDLSNENKVTYVTSNKEEIVDLTSSNSQIKKIEGESSSTVGKFFFSDKSEITEETFEKKEVYYFVNTKKGMSKKNLFETIGGSDEDIFLKEISETENAYIETLSARFKDKEAEKDRKKRNISKTQYVLHFPKEELEILKNVNFE